MAPPLVTRLHPEDYSVTAGAYLLSGLVIDDGVTAVQRAGRSQEGGAVDCD